MDSREVVRTTALAFATVLVMCILTATAVGTVYEVAKINTEGGAILGSLLVLGLCYFVASRDTPPDDSSKHP